MDWRLESANGLHTLLLVLIPIVWIENGGAGGSPEEKQGLLTRRMLNDMQVGKTQIYLRRHGVCGHTETNHKNDNCFS